MATYLAYVQGGKCKDTHAPHRDEEGNKIPQPNTFKQFWVQEELINMGVESWCGSKIEFYRTGKDRFAKAHESPFLPNYLFIDADANKFIDVIGVKFIAPTLQLVPLAEMDKILLLKEAVQEAYEAAERVDANSKAAIAEYKAGQALEAMRGAFQDVPMWFKRIVQEGHDPWPKVEAEIEVFGGKVPIRLDPLDVRAAS